MIPSNIWFLGELLFRHNDWHKILQIEPGSGQSSKSNPLGLTEGEPSEQILSRVHKDKTRHFKCLPHSFRGEEWLEKVYVKAGLEPELGGRWSGWGEVGLLLTLHKAPSLVRKYSCPFTNFYGHRAVGASWRELSDVVCAERQHDLSLREVRMSHSGNNWSNEEGFEGKPGSLTTSDPF